MMLGHLDGPGLCLHIKVLPDHPCRLLLLCEAEHSQVPGLTLGTMGGATLPPQCRQRLPGSLSSPPKDGGQGVNGTGLKGSK